MKRFLCFFLSFLFLFSPLACLAEEQHPVIALSRTPILGDSSNFEGRIFKEDGSSCDFSNYRLALYIQLSENGEYWVKPTYQTPYIEINNSPLYGGYFSAKYDTGGYDEQAVALHFFLISKDFTPNKDFDRTKKAALDYVKVTRNQNGEVLVNPKRELPKEYSHYINPKISVEENKIALNLGLHPDGTAATSDVNENLFKMQLNTIKPFTHTVRFYSAVDNENLYKIAKDEGFYVIGSAWISKNTEDDMEEMAALIELCNKGLVDAAVVGSEAILRQAISPLTLATYINYVRRETKALSIPVTTADSINFIENSQILREACDFYFVNIYPFWNNVEGDKAADYFTKTLENFSKKFPDKALVCSECGWPTAGNSKEKAVPSEETAAKFFEEIQSWSLKQNIPVVFFSSCDEPFKDRQEGNVGSHWGILDTDLKMKPSYWKSNFFQKTLKGIGLSNYQEKNEALSFSDVSSGSWYFENVKMASSLGFMQGTGKNSFNPDAYMTIAQTLALASRIRNLYYGENESFNEGSPWYQVYVDYAKDKGFYMETGNYQEVITRAKAAEIFAAALPKEAFYSLNDVEDGKIPDISENASYKDAVYLLYRAGILSGVDKAGNFNPEGKLTRAAMAAIATRIAKPSLRNGY